MEFKAGDRVQHHMGDPLSRVGTVEEVYRFGLEVRLDCGNAVYFSKRYTQLIKEKEVKNKPRKHAEVIKAWADGADIQFRVRDVSDWKDDPRPSWVPSLEYRVKPEMRKFRVALLDRGDVVAIDNHATEAEGWNSFVRWLTDWQEYEV